MHLKKFNNFIIVLPTLLFLAINSILGNKSNTDKVYDFIDKILQIKNKNDDSFKQSKEVKNLSIVIKYISCYEKTFNIYLKYDLKKEEVFICIDAVKQVYDCLLNLYNNKISFKKDYFKTIFENLLRSITKLVDRNALKNLFLELIDGIIDLIVDKEIKTENEFIEVISKMEKTKERMKKFVVNFNDIKKSIENLNESIDEYKLLYNFYSESVKTKNLIECSLFQFTEISLSSKINELYNLFYKKLIVEEPSENLKNMAECIVSFVITATKCELHIKLLKKYKKNFTLLPLLRIFTYEEKYLSILSKKFYNFIENKKNYPKFTKISRQYYILMKLNHLKAK